MGTNETREDKAAPPPTPRWLRLFGMIAAAFLALFVILHLTGLVGMGHMGHHH